MLALPDGLTVTVPTVAIGTGLLFHLSVSLLIVVGSEEMLNW
jgi:hypothetical protein